MAKLAKRRAVKEKDNKLEDHILAEGAVVEEAAAFSGEKDIAWDAKQGEVQSSTNLEDDLGEGAPVIIRTFFFKANPVAFRHHTPSSQELFNAHLKQIEVHLWTDGMKIMTDVTPKVSLSKKRDGYKIVVGAEPAKGFLLSQTPQTLTEIAHGK